MKILVAMVLMIGIAVAVAQSITERTKFVGLPPAARRTLVEKAVVLKRGDSYQTVTNALGKPDLDRNVGGRSDRPGLAERVLEYYLWRPEGASSDNPYADFVQVILDLKTQRIDMIKVKATLQ